MNYTVTGYYKDYYSLHVEADSEQDAMEKFRSGNYDHQMNSVEQGK